MNDHDTDPSELNPDSERTPLESPYSLKAISMKLDAVVRGINSVASNQLTVVSRVDRLATALEELALRVTALEVSRGWAPLVLSSIALVVALWTLFQVRS